MTKSNTTFLYCYASGKALFGRRLPKGAIKIDQRTDDELAQEKVDIKAQKKAFENGTGEYPGSPWKERMRARMRMGYDGKTMLVPGVPEAESQNEKFEALHRFIKWAVKGEKVKHAASN